MFPRLLFVAFKLLVVVFPIGAGLFLTNLGVTELNEANVAPIKQWPTPFGFLVFSSAQLRGVESHIWLGDQFISVKNDTASCLIHFIFETVNLSSGEQIFGFQLPGVVELLKPVEHPERSFSVNGDNGHGMVSAGILDEKAVFVEDERISLVYAKFVVLVNVSRYEGNLFCALRDSRTKRIFQHII